MTNIQDRIVRDPEVTILTGLSRSQRYVLEKNNLFPRRRKLSPIGKATGLLLSEIMEWVSSRPVTATTSTKCIGNGKSGPGRGNKKQPAVTA
ncbi:MAG: helix-turn-helix transcriptional regulator [Desulfuromonadaceae bacterium]